MLQKYARGSDDMPARAGVGEAGGREHIGPIHLPDVDLAAVVLKQDVGKPVAVKVARPDHVPADARIAETAAGDHARLVQLPDIDFAIGVLPQDVRFAVAVEIARSLDLPGG